MIQHMQLLPKVGNICGLADEQMLLMKGWTQHISLQKNVNNVLSHCAEGLAKAAPTHGEPEHMNVAEDTNVIEEGSDEESSEDEHVTYHVRPVVAT